MSITQDLAAVVTAADNLTQQVSDKINQIDQRVDQFHTEATNIASAATSQMYRAKIGLNQFPQVDIVVTPQDDAGVLVQQAFDAGNKQVFVSWANDGQDRHWNTAVNMPVGGALYITGNPSAVGVIGGNVRTGRACYARGRNGGTSELSSPMIFRNLKPADTTFPYSEYGNVWDDISLIVMNGNNTIVFGDGTYVFDLGGMIPHAYGCGLIQMSGYAFDLPCFVGGCYGSSQFYLGGPLLNNQGSTSTCEIRMMSVDFIKLDNDGPTLDVDKGYKRLLSKGVAGVTPDLLYAQPYTLTDEQLALNDNLHPGAFAGWVALTRGTGTETDRPRIVSRNTWSFPTGWVKAQFYGGKGELSLHGLEQTGTTDIWQG